MNADDIQLRRRPAVHRYSPKSRILLHTSNCPEIYPVFIYLITKAKGHTGHLHRSKIYTIELSGAATGWEGGSFPPLWVDVQKLCTMCVHCSKCVSFWGTSYSRPPIHPYLTSPLLQNPGGAFDRARMSSAYIGLHRWYTTKIKNNVIVSVNVNSRFM